MSFAHNFEDNQPPTRRRLKRSTSTKHPSEGTSAKVATTLSSVADTFDRNFSDNQPLPTETPPTPVTAVPCGLASASDVTSGDKVVGWSGNRGLEVAGQKSREFDRRVGEGIAKSYPTTLQGVERTRDKMKSSSKTDVREGELLLPL